MTFGIRWVRKRCFVLGRKWRNMSEIYDSIAVCDGIVRGWLPDAISIDRREVDLRLKIHLERSDRVRKLKPRHFYSCLSLFIPNTAFAYRDRQITGDIQNRSTSRDTVQDPGTLCRRSRNR